MIGTQKRWQEDLFIAGSLSSLIPDDHILKQVDKVLDLSWLRKEVSDLYCQTNGRPGIDPEAAVRLMLAGFFQGVVHDRKLMREAQVNIAIRWFAGYRFDEKLPDHSSLTKIRQRWGPERFKKIFLKTVQSCIDANLVNGETIHVDATLIRADVSWESVTTQHAETVIKENESKDDKPKRWGRPKKKAKPKKRSTTDPDASMATSCKKIIAEPSYKQHGAVDDVCGVIVDVEITTGQVSEGSQLPCQVERIESNTGIEIETLSADAGYGNGKNYRHLKQKNIDAIIPPKNPGKRRKCIPLSEFKYDAKHKIVKCPGNKILTPRTESKLGMTYRAKAKDCDNCRMRSACFGFSSASRTVVIVDGYDALLGARRRHKKPDKKFMQTYSRHQWKIEGMHGEAKTQHGLRRAVRRGLDNMSIQAYLTAAVINLKRLATYAGGFYDNILNYLARILVLSKMVLACGGILRSNGMGIWQLDKIEQL
jgi:transposase